MAELYADQAAGLRRLFAREPLRVVTFAAGSHGVGKSVLVANVAACLAQQGRTVLVLDESIKKNVASCFGVSSRLDLLHVVNRERSLSEVLQHVAQGVLVLPAAKAVKKLGKFDERQQQALTASLSAIEDPVDVILVDASQDHPLGFSPLGLAAHETVIVMSPTPAWGPDDSKRRSLLILDSLLAMRFKMPEMSTNAPVSAVAAIMSAALVTGTPDRRANSGITTST